MLKYGVTYESHVSELSRIKDAALKKNSFSAAVNAETNRGKAAGLYIDRKIIKTGKLEEMTEEQLEAKMKQICEKCSNGRTHEPANGLNQKLSTSKHYLKVRARAPERRVL
jgi:hypothetical protein